MNIIFYSILCRLIMYGYGNIIMNWEHICHAIVDDSQD